MQSVFLITTELEYEGPFIDGVYDSLEAAVDNANEHSGMYTFVSEYTINSDKIVRKWRVQNGIARSLKKKDQFNWEWDP